MNKNAKVLVVDDSPSILITMQKLLHKFCIAAHTAATGEAAVHILQGETEFDAVFLDYLLPGLDGIETLMRIRAIGTEYALSIPIIAMTAFSDAQVFFNNGFQGYLQKPITRLSLETVIKEVFPLNDDISVLQPIYEIVP